MRVVVVVEAGQGRGHRGRGAAHLRGQRGRHRRLLGGSGGHHLLLLAGGVRRLGARRPPGEVRGQRGRQQSEAGVQSLAAGVGQDLEAGPRLGLLRPRQLLEAVEDGGGRQEAGRGAGEGVVLRRVADHRLHHLPQLLGVRGGGAQLQPGDDVVQVVQRRDGGQLPAQLLQHQQLPLLSRNTFIQSHYPSIFYNVEEQRNETQIL